MAEDISIGYWIKRRRKSLDLTQKDLADRVGCAVITIAKIEADERKPSREVAGLLAKHLQIPAEQTALFVSILRGEKGFSQLHRLGEAQPPVLLPESIPADDLRRFAPLQPISRGRLVGRRAELATALQAWDAARAGESRVLILHGEPGIGKSRLAAELAGVAREQRGRVLVGECYAGGEGLYAPFARLFQSISTFPPDFPATGIADLKVISPQLGARFPGIPANPRLEPLAEQMRVLESACQFFSLLAREMPLLLLVEDIHWADHGSLELIKTLARRFRQSGLPVLVILTSRDELPPESYDLPALFDELLRAHLSTDIHLGRFSEEETRELLVDSFGQPITDEFVRLIQRETQGNPFFIEEVCKELIETGAIYRANGKWERKEIREIQVPQSVQNAIKTRLNKLPRETQDILLMAAVLGKRFYFDVLQAALGIDEDTLIEALEIARRSQVILDADSSGGIAFEFSHNLISTVLLDTASPPRRRKLHRQAVTALEAIQPDEYSQLAYHCRAADDVPRALRYYRKAAERAMQIYAHEDALRAFAEALALPGGEAGEVCLMLLARARVYDVRGERALQLADLEFAAARASQAGDLRLRAEVELAFAEYNLQISQQDSVIEHACRAIDLAEQTGANDIQAQAHMLWGRAFSETGELQLAREHLAQARALARQGGMDLLEARSLINLGNVDFRQGDVDAAREKYLQALGPVRQAGERRIESMVLNNLGNIAWAKGDLDGALAHYAQTLTTARQIGDRLNEARALSNSGSIYTEQHRYPEALQNLEQALALVQDLGQRMDEVMALSHLSEVMTGMGRYDEALATAERALEFAREIEDVQGEASILVQLSRLALLTGDAARAERLAREVISLASVSHLPAEEVEGWSALGAVRMAGEQWADADEAYTIALNLYNDLGMVSAVAQTTAELARLAEIQGNHARARQLLAQLLPTLDPANLPAEIQPTVCLCAYRVLLQDEPSTGLALLECGYTALQATLQAISDPGGREHYLNGIPNHRLLAQTWQEAHDLEIEELS